MRVSPGDTAFTGLEFASYPWTHSLAAVGAWTALGAAIGRRLWGTWRAGGIVGGLVFSHWVLDFLTHRPDLPLWPGGPLVGLGLWNSVPATLVVETALLAVGLWLFLDVSRARDRMGRWSLVGLVALCVVLWASAPWAPPPPSARAVALGSLILWILPPWAHWIERHRTRAPGTESA